MAQPASFERNIQFSALIKAGDRVREFNFRKPTRQEGETIFVDVADEKGDRHHFSLVREGQRWRFHDTKLPVWISSIESKLVEAITAQAGSSAI